MPFATSRARTASRFGRLLAFAVLSATLLGTAACGSDDKSPTEPEPSLNGTYDLMTIDGDEPSDYGVASGDLDIDDSNWKLTLRPEEGEAVSVDGQYTRSGNSIDFGEGAEGTISGDRITVDVPDFFDDGSAGRLVFEK